MSLLEIANGMHDEWCVLCIIPPCFCALQGTHASSLFILIDKRNLFRNTYINERCRMVTLFKHRYIMRFRNNI